MNAPDTRVPVLRRGFRFQWEPVQNSHVLLYPEGMIRLNETAGLILAEVDGKRDVSTLIAELQARFPDAGDISGDIQAFLEIAREQFWIEFR